MQPVFIALALWGIIALPARALTVHAFVDGSGDGLWHNPLNWSETVLPGAADNAVINKGLSCTVADPVAALEYLTVGNTSHTGTVLHIRSDMNVGALRVAWPTGASGRILQTDGAVRVDSLFRMSSDREAAVFAGYEVTGGSLTLDAAAMQLGTQGAATFSILGSTTQWIRAKALVLGPGGRLRFTLDARGVTPLEIETDTAWDPSSALEVDGSAYEGQGGMLPLILYPRDQSTSSVTNITFVGFGAREPVLIEQEDGLWLRLRASVGYSDLLCSPIPESRVTMVESGSVYTASPSYAPAAADGSEWGIDFSEGHVMDMRLSSAVEGDAGSVRSWDLRVGRGGHIYSLRTPSLGETVPPSFHGVSVQDSPWNDEVWQAVAVNTDLNDPDAGNPYFLHQSGPYLRDPALKLPYYSPQVASFLDPRTRSFTTVNWLPQAHVNIYTDGDPSNDFRSYVLCYARFKDLGQGVIEVTLGQYNYGPDRISHMNMPWGGVRRTSLEHAFVADPDPGTWQYFTKKSWGASDNLAFQFQNIGGWVAFCPDAAGGEPALGLVFGAEANPWLPGQFTRSVVRLGYAGLTTKPGEADWRNYLVASVIRRVHLVDGRGLWSRYYFVLGDDVADVAQRISERDLVAPEMRMFAIAEQDSPLLGYRIEGTGDLFRVERDGVRPSFWLYAHPVQGSLPVFEIHEGDGTHFLSWNPYANGMVKPYDGSLNRLRLLGFAMPGTATNAFVTYTALADSMAAHPGHFLPDGKSLFTRKRSYYQDWCLTHFGTPLAEGIAGAGEDPDGDGIRNLEEYAFGGDPENPPSSASGLQLSRTESGLALQFPYRADAEARGLSWEVEGTDDLLAPNWSRMEGGEVETLSEDAGLNAMRLALPADALPALRLRIALEE